MKKGRKQAVRLVMVFTAALFLMGGCGIEKTSRTRIRDMEYRILAAEEVPEALKTQIDEKKEADFKMTYETPEHLYIVRGYGEQETGGYSIQVKELYLSSNAVFFSSELIGPRKGENAAKSPSCPYIVIETEKADKNVVFD